MRTSAGLQTEAVYIFHNMVRKLRAVAEVAAGCAAPAFALDAAVRVDCVVEAAPACPSMRMYCPS